MRKIYETYNYKESVFCFVAIITEITDIRGLVYGVGHKSRTKGFEIILTITNIIY